MTSWPRAGRPLARGPGHLTAAPAAGTPGNCSSCPGGLERAGARQAQPLPEERRGGPRREGWLRRPRAQRGAPDGRTWAEGRAREPRGRPAPASGEGEARPASAASSASPPDAPFRGLSNRPPLPLPLPLAVTPRFSARPRGAAQAHSAGAGRAARDVRGRGGASQSQGFISGWRGRHFVRRTINGHGGRPAARLLLRSSCSPSLVPSSLFGPSARPRSAS